MDVASLVTVLKNWLYIKKKFWNKLHFLCADANSRKLKVSLIIFEQFWSKIGIAFWVMEL